MKQTILIVDDDVHVREMIQVMLGTAGFDVVQAANGDSALSRLGAGGVDLMITDLRLPEMDGGTLISRVRGESGLETLPILVLSGYADAVALPVPGDGRKV
jgi:CheY-like chemotaxis protein